MVQTYAKIEYVALGFAALCVLLCVQVWLVLERRYAGELASVYARLQTAITRVEAEKTARLGAQERMRSAIEENRLLRMVLEEMESRGAPSSSPDMLEGAAVRAASLVLRKVPMGRDVDYEKTAKCAALGALCTVHQIVGFSMERMLREDGIEPLYSMQVMEDLGGESADESTEEETNRESDPTTLQ